MFVDGGTFIDCTFIDNVGITRAGAIDFAGGTSISITGCYFEGNEADFGGAIFTQSNSVHTIENTTFYANKALVGSGKGSAIGSTGNPFTINLNGVTFYQNESEGTSGAVDLTSGTFNFRNTIFDGNFDTGGDHNCEIGFVTFTSQGYNLSNTGSAECNTVQGTDRNNESANFSGAPQDNGGNTL